MLQQGSGSAAAAGEASPCFIASEGLHVCKAIAAAVLQLQIGLMRSIVMAATVH
jgi:hypothetical protein